MNSYTILKLIKCIKQDNIDGAYKRSIGGAEVAIATPYYTQHANRRARRTEILLSTLTEDELNDLRTVLAIGRTAGLNATSGKYEPKRKDDLTAWRSYLHVEKLTQAESLKEIKRTPTYKILEHLNAYIDLQPMTNIRRNFMRIMTRKH